MNKIVLVVSILAAYLLLCFLVSKIFKKANKKWYLAFIPVVNFIVLLNIAGYKWYYIFEYAITLFVGLFIYFKHYKNMLLIVIMIIAAVLFVYYYVSLNVRVGKRFNKSKLFLLFMVIPVIPYIVLAFDKSVYKEV